MAWCCCPFRDAFGFNFSSNRETKIADVFHSDRSGVRRSTLRRREGPGLQLTSEAAPLGGGWKRSGRTLGGFWAMSPEACQRLLVVWAGLQGRQEGRWSRGGGGGRGGPAIICAPGWGWGWGDGPGRI